MLPALPADARIARRMALTMVLFEAAGAGAGIAIAYAVNAPGIVGMALWLGGLVAGYQLGRRVLAAWGHPWPRRARQRRATR